MEGIFAEQGSKAIHHYAQKLNQGTLPGTGCIRSRLSFFRSFLDKQKRTSRVQ
jgi:hypothetical protein